MGAERRRQDERARGDLPGLSGRSFRTRNEREAIAFGQPLARVEAEVADAGETRAFLWSLDRSGEHRHLIDDSPAGAEHSELRPASIFLPTAWP